MPNGSQTITMPSRPAATSDTQKTFNQSNGALVTITVVNQGVL